MSNDSLTALDGTFVELEDADPAAHMHLGAILVFGPLPDGRTPSLRMVRDHLDARLDALPRYRQRLAGPGAGRLAWQRWVTHDGFDIADHVSAGLISAPGGWEQLLEWASGYFSRRLDRSRPLWDVVLLTGLGAGHWALVTKTHHCMVDGVGSVQAAHLLFDGADGMAAVPAPGSARAAIPDVLGAGLHAALHPRETARRGVALAELLVREEIQGAADLSINRPIGPERVLRAAAIDLDEARAVKAALGGTLNDVVLAGVCAGLRTLLRSRGEALPARGVRVMVPMNVRSGDRDGALGNRISSLFVELPVAEPNPVARYERICAETGRVKRGSQPLGADSLLALTQLTPPLVHQIAARRLFGKRLFNLTVTNVPGPQVPLSALGAPLKTVWPLVPLASDHALGVAVFSYDGRLTYGINADRAGMPDVDVFADGLTEGLRVLQQVARAAGGPLAAASG